MTNILRYPPWYCKAILAVLVACGVVAFYLLFTLEGPLNAVENTLLYLFCLAGVVSAIVGFEISRPLEDTESSAPNA